MHIDRLEREFVGAGVAVAEVAARVPAVPADAGVAVAEVAADVPGSQLPLLGSCPRSRPLRSRGTAARCPWRRRRPRCAGRRRPSGQTSRERQRRR